MVKVSYRIEIYDEGINTDTAFIDNEVDLDIYLNFYKAKGLGVKVFRTTTELILNHI